MTLTTRFAAGFLALSFGVSAPLMASATPQDASEQPFAHHTSSRMMASQANALDTDFEAQRARLWALTENGGAPQCITDGVAAPCSDVVALGAAN